MHAASAVEWSSGIATACVGSDLRSLFDEADRELYAKKSRRERRSGHVADSPVRVHRGAAIASTTASGPPS
jgi:hypothetical protein